MKQAKFLETEALLHDPNYEHSETLITGRQFRLERIISIGHQTPHGQWYDQEHDEWVLLVQGNASVESESGHIAVLKPGDYLFIPAHERHRVAETSSDTPCFWLALHGQFDTDVSQD
ncbi:MAG: cupin domain-containing protein [Bacteroidales bacterium]|nr:cupin domain-containing protein [Bacteroidales bacterium]MDZ4205552.1 cupin domain-containing protein [Bacteroidales bacterium]